MGNIKNKNILFLLNSFDVGGTERYTYQLCSFIASVFNSVIIASGGGIWASETKIRDVNYVPIKKMTKFSLLSFLINIIILRKIIKTNKIDIIHIQRRIFFIILPFLPKRNIRIIYTAHCFFSDILQKFIRADHVIAISENVKENLINTTKLKQNQIWTIQNGTEIKELKLDDKRKINNIGYVGRLEKEKGVELLLRAFLYIREKNRDVFLHIWGSGSLENAIRMFITKNKLSHVVKLNKPTTDLDELYQSFELLAYPTLLNETLPLSVMEAMAYSKIVLVSKTEGNKNVLKTGENCILLEELTEFSIAHKILFIQKLSNIEINRIRINGYSMVKRNYNINTMKNEYLQFYENILK